MELQGNVSFNKCKKLQKKRQKNAKNWVVNHEKNVAESKKKSKKCKKCAFLENLQKKNAQKMLKNAGKCEINSPPPVSCIFYRTIPYYTIFRYYNHAILPNYSE